MDILDRIDAAVGCQQCGGELGDSPSDDFCSEVCQRRWRTEHHAEVLVGYREPWQRPEDFPGVGTEAHDTSGERGGFHFDLNPGGLIAAVDEFYGWARAERVQPRHYSIGNWCPNPSMDVSVEGWGYPEIPRVPAETYVECASDGCPMLIRVRVSASTDRRLCPAHDWALQQEDWRLPRQTGDLRADIRACNRARDLASTDAQRAAVRLRTKQLASRTRLSLNVNTDPVRRAFEQLARDLSEMAEQIGRGLGRALAQQSQRPSRVLGDGDRADAMRLALNACQNRNTGPQQRPSAPRTIGRPTTAGRR